MDNHITGNIGEWSEIYALFKLLGDGKIHAGDEDMNLTDIYYPILAVLRQEQNNFYQYSTDPNRKLVIVIEDKQKLFEVDVLVFQQEAQKLLLRMKQAKKNAERTFCAEDAEAFMQSIKCKTLKADANQKADIRIVIHDLRTGMTPTLGFSIKSQIGGHSTLLNASNATMLTFQIKGANLSDEQIEQINLIDSQQERMSKLQELGGTLQLHEYANSTFEDNLIFTDSLLPQVLALYICDYYTTKKSKFNDLTPNIASINPINVRNPHIYYEHKIKQLLVDAALGMTPASVWTGIYDATGGYIVVKENGDMVCYHFYNRNELENYLYKNTRFDSPTRKRYGGWGTLYRGEDGNVYIKLNFQIRFIN